MKFLFPLPLAYNGNESRFLQRDGARFAAEFVNRGHTGIKLIVDDGSGHPKPQSPLLDTATWTEWCSKDYWAKSGANLVLLYGGLERKLLPVAKAIHSAGIPLFLKMDSAIGVPPHWNTDFCRLLRTNYHYHHQSHSMVIAMLKSASSRLMTMSGLGTNRLPEYLKLFDVITVECDYAMDNTKKWLVGHDLPHVAERVKLLLHPIPDSFRFDPHQHFKKKMIIAIAEDWTNPRKGGKLLVKVLSRVLVKRLDYSAVIVGGDGESIAKKIIGTNSALSCRVTALAKIESEKTKDFYSQAQILITTSGSEGWPLVVSEAACCGCSVVFPPELKQLEAFEKSAGGRMAKSRTTQCLTDAVLNECNAWGGGLRDPVSISDHWCNLAHTSQCCDTLIDWLPTSSDC